MELSVNDAGQQEVTNLTILNVFLVQLGPMREVTLVKVLICSQVSRLGAMLDRCRILILFQVAGSVLAFFVRYGLAGLVYDGNRR